MATANKENFTWDGFGQVCSLGDEHSACDVSARVDRNGSFGTLPGMSFLPPIYSRPII